MPEETQSIQGLGKIPSAFLGIGMIWLTIASVIQHGWWSGLLRPLALFVGISFVLGAVSGFRQQRRSQTAIFGLLFVAGAWLYFSGSFASMHLMLWDLAAVFIGFLIVSLLMAVASLSGFDLDRIGSRKPQVFTFYYFSVFLLMVWATITAMHVLRSKPLAVDPDRFALVAEQTDSLVPEHSVRWQNRRIGLALSGGGYRAALFHAGVLHALERLGVHVTHLSTVSGGSIAGAYYAVGGDPIDLKNAIRKGRFNLRRELLLIHHGMRLALPLRIPVLDVELFPWSYDRRDVQASLVRRLLFDGGEARLHANNRQPRLMINATELTWGFLVGMTDEGLLFQGPSPGAHFYEEGQLLHLSEDLDLADRVAISGAFPVAFPPEHIGATLETPHGTGRGTRPLTLADGGIADNLGIMGLQSAVLLAGTGDVDSSSSGVAGTKMDASWKVDALLVSDASAAFDVRSELSLVGIIARLFDVAGTLGGRGECGPVSSAVCFSARRHLAPPESLFVAYDSDQDLADDRQTRLSFQPYFFPEPILRAWVGIQPAQGPSALESALEDFLDTSPFHRHPDALDGYRLPDSETTIEPSLSSVPPLEECRQMRDAGKKIGPRALGPATCEAAALRKLLLEDIRETLLVFRRASTLADTFSEQDTEALFRLGQSLVYLEWPRLSKRLLGEAQPNATP